jgi:preprotein translocase subunit SecG
METIVWVIHVLVALAVIGLVLLQHGKGADMGAAFGSGASGSLFGASGSANFLSHATAILAAIFFVTSLSLAYLTSHRDRHLSVIEMQKKSHLAPVASTKTQDKQPAGVQPSKAQDVPQ